MKDMWHFLGSMETDGRAYVGCDWKNERKAGLFGANSSISSNELEGLRWEAFHEISLEKII